MVGVERDMLTATDLHIILPAATGENIDRFWQPLNDSMDEWQINSPTRQAAFLAQIGHESGSLRYVREIASGEAYEGRADLGNTKPEAVRIAAKHGSTPGRFWRGHGLIMITGYDNHMDCGVALGVDVVDDPAALERPELAARSAGWWWQAHGCNEIADSGNFQKLTKRINGGLTGLADRMAIWKRAKEQLA